MKLFLKLLILLTFLIDVSLGNEESKSINKTVTSHEENDNSLFQKLRKLINLIDQLRDCGVQEYIQLPRIATLGTQSSGKSSVLESIVGLDFLPRGDGVVTRRPLELRLNNIASGENWAVFEEIKDKKFTDFKKVKETIESLTEEVCKNEKNIVDKPIILNVYCQTCPDLTLIDLPGITRVPVGKQPSNIEEITINMAKRYINNPLTIILCVIAANVDISTSDGLKLAKEVDVDGSRTIGVLTKLDLMDKGADAKKAIMNEEIPLKYGYVGVINRSKQDLIDKLPMEEMFRKEKNFFDTHPVYKKMLPGYFGINILIQKLSRIYYKVIKRHLPSIIKSINDNIIKTEEEIKHLGIPMPTDEVGKLNKLINMINEFCNIYLNVIKGKYDVKRSDYIKEDGGYKIKIALNNLLSNFTGNYKVTQNYTDDEIKNAMKIYDGDSFPGFPSIDAFYSLLRPKLDELKGPIDSCYYYIYTYLEELAQKILEKTMTGYQRVIEEVGDLVTSFLVKEKEKTKYIIESIFDQEVGYLFTNDKEYLDNYSDYISKKQIDTIQQNKKKEEITSQKLYVNEIRERLDAYFKICVRNLRENIPKAIGFHFVKSIEKNMQIKIYEMLYKSKESILHTLDEPEEIQVLRKVYNNRIKIMKDAQKIIKRDPDLIREMSPYINDKNSTSGK